METDKGKHRTVTRTSRDSSNATQSNTKAVRKGTERLTHDTWQSQFLETKGDKVLCCGRQVGKTEICSEDAAEYAINNPDTKPILMIAPTERQSYALFNKTLTYLVNNYPSQIKMGKDRPTKEKITLKSGVLIYCLPVGTSGIGIRFLTVGRLYVDEAARIPEEVWAAVSPMLLTTGGDSIYLSTPYGAQGEFWRCFVNKDQAYNSFTRFSVDSETVVRNRTICNTWSQLQQDKALEKLEQAKARMSKREYAQEYLGRFMDDLHRFFSDKLIKEVCTLKRKQEVGIDHKKYYLGCDIARMGEDEGTFEIIHKIDDNRLELIESIVTRKKFTTDTYDKIIDLNKIFNFKQIGIDAGSGSLGVGILDFLLRNVEVKRKVVPLNNLKIVLDEEGHKRGLLKEDMYFNLLALMEKGIVKLLDDSELMSSLASVQYEYVMKAGNPTKLRIFGNYTHIAEGIVRAVYLANQKHLNSFIGWI